MRKIVSIAAMAAALSLMACDNSNSANAANNGATPTTDNSAAADKAGGKAAADKVASLPDFLLPYEGAKVIEGAKEVPRSPNDDPHRSGATMTFTTPDAVEDVIGFYATRSEMFGHLHLNRNDKTDNGQVYIASNREWQVNVNAQRDGDVTKVKLTWYHTQK